MNNHHAPPPPPGPPPGPPRSPATQQRRPVQVPSITTTLSAAHRFGSHLQPGTPASARSGHTPSSPQVSSPYSPHPSPSMASVRVPANINTYNPQEWRRGGPVSGSYMPHSSQAPPRRMTSTRDATGMESFMPSPPPPYSPSPQSAQPSSRGLYPSPNAPSFSSSTASPTNNSDYPTPISAATSISSGGFPSFQRTNSMDQSPNTVTQSSPSSYPPPPAANRDRSGSRSRFNISSLASRHRSNPSASSNNAMDNLQQQTNATLAQYAPRPVLATVPVVPPSARRAASTGAISTVPSNLGRDSPEVSVTQSPEQVNHGFALPPPPPGPPPGGRSQSMSRVLDRDTMSSNAATPVSAAPVAARAAAMRSSQLGPIPPTPADWVDEDIRWQTRQAATPQPDVPVQRQVDARTPVNHEGRRTASGASRAEPPPALPRDPSVVRGIRERRSESRASREPSASREPGTSDEQSHGANVSEAKPADLVLQPSGSGALGRRRHVSKAKISPLLDGRASPHLQRYRRDSDAGSSQPGSASLLHGQGSARDSAPSTPFSSGQRSDQTSESPATRPQSSNEPSGSGKGRPREAPMLPTLDTSSSSSAKQRPVSHILHTPIDEMQNMPALVPSRSSSADRQPASKDKNQKPDFAAEAIARHTRFIEMEAIATSDEERLQLFADFIVHESRLRRDRYSEAFDGLGSDVLDLTRDMWRPYQLGKRHKKTLPSIDTTMSQKAPANPQPSSGSDMQPDPSSGTSTSNINSDAFTPSSAPESPVSVSSPMQPRNRATARNPFQPMLSPIQSMAMSTIIDDSESSRGRTASRWWETSTDANSVGGARRVERTKRETKYMGLPKEARENLQWESIPEDSPAVPGSSRQAHFFGPDEYPPEKVGWHEDVAYAPDHARNPHPKTPEPHGMDVSRLITLPPPYPRHHPAVNNKHPDLAPLRSVLRSLNSRDEVSSVRGRYDAEQGTLKTEPEQSEAIAERRKKFRRAVQGQVSNGEMTFAEAAKAEADFDEKEAKRGREQAQKGFDHFQAEVLAPLNKMFNDGINKATTSIEQLSDSLSYEAQSHNPNQTQEEGDEKPELLEKLTLIKWIHEARELLYKEMFNLEGESDERYKTLILIPYHQAGNEEKIHEVQSFFERDSEERRAKYEKKALKRFEELLRTTEQHVTRGAEVQLSAFWDIAPELLAVIQKVPTELENFDLQIPPHEFDENPHYREFPMQYLYSLLSHSEKSAYQFIEAQINLLCLLHEVKSAMMNASCRLMETQRVMEGETSEEVEKEMREIRKGEDTSLTTELKERVGLVEEQWRQALGKGLEECKERVQEFLFDSGGWDESLEE